MKRVLAVGIGLVLVLAIWWTCCDNAFPVVQVHSENRGPMFYEVPSQPQDTQPQETQESVKPSAYSCVIAKGLLSFDGPYMENGTQEEVIGVAALELWNTDDTMLDYVEAVVFQGERCLRFEATYIPSGGKILILEKDGQLYSPEAVTDFQCPTVIRSEKRQVPELVRVEESGMCKLTVTNQADKPLKCVRVFYKEYNAQYDMYIGGITYSLVLTDLQAGESKTVSPYRYAADCSRIVSLVIDE